MKTPVMSTTKKCRECDGELAFFGYKHVEKVGRWTVKDNTSMAWQCLACKTAQLSLDELQHYQLCAAKTALCDGKTDGGVAKYARKALGLTQKELGLLLGYQHETVCKWENDKEPMKRSASVALTGVLCRAMAGEEPEDMVTEARASIEGNEMTPSHAIEVRRKAI